MKLILGGAFQGKRSFAQAQYHCETWFDFQNGEPQTPFDGFCHLEELTRRETLLGGSAAALLARMAPYWANAVIVSREIGSGVVPIDAADRAWRELHGQTLQALASQADQVIRIFCGLPEVLK